MNPASEKPYPVGGVRLAAVASGIRYKKRLDLVLLELAAGSTVAGVFTRNQFCAAPVTIARERVAKISERFSLDSRFRGNDGARESNADIHQAIQDGRRGQRTYLLINTGYANAGTGAAGEEAALVCCRELAGLAGVDERQVLPFSTGVIGEPLPTVPIISALPAALAALSPDGWEDAARGIMTTDTRPKLRSVRLDLSDGPVHITGMAKGAGMIKPNMATLLAFVCTDAALPQSSLNALLHEAVEGSFNRITVDGDTSTNDACILAATGGSGVTIDTNWTKFKAALLEVFRQLARDLMLDAEGASKLIRVTVAGGANRGECLRAAYAVAESPLVKTACFASDPNWGRILAAVGRAGIPGLDISAVELHLGGTPLVRNGGLHPEYSEAKGKAAMSGREIPILVHLNRGDAEETVLGCDLSHDYIRINAEYRT